MKKNYFLPQTEIFPHIMQMECMQGTIFNANDTPILVGDEEQAP